MNLNWFGKATWEKATIFKKKECSIHAAVIQVVQEVEEAFFNAARSKTALEKGNSLFHGPPIIGRCAHLRRRFPTG